MRIKSPPFQPANLTNQINLPLYARPVAFIDMVKFDIYMPEGADIGNLANEALNKFVTTTGLTYYVDAITKEGRKMFAMTVTIHKPRSIRDVELFLNYINRWRTCEFKGFCYIEFGIDIHLKNWMHMSGQKQKLALGEAIAYFLSRKPNFGSLSGKPLISYRQRKHKMTDETEGVNIDSVAELTAKGFNLRVGEKNACRIANKAVPDLYFHFYVKTRSTINGKLVDLERQDWRARFEIGVRGSELAQVLSPGGFKLETLAHHFSLPKLKVNQRSYKDGTNWARQGSSYENGPTREALKNRSRGFKSTRLQNNGSIFSVSKF
ncbi:hypothetical protein LIMNO130_10286 [Limnobacter sp. 130]|uniref:hypothetical protein n=1 Tax=Limnobacter sp. 130 TaxID=2653147 RepID=UPI0012EF3930|nr:hypothetical protein [Limnobacter sp. 130]VWX32816.1 hypothetical protein LIMNO130_10286 [Limnobacter sp. 130]